MRKSKSPSSSTVTVDVSYGGMFYVIADAKPFGLRLTPDEGRDIVRIGEMIKAATQEQLQAVHPENPEIAGVTIAQLSGPPAHPDAEVKNAVIVSTGVLDWNRPSTWTGALVIDPLAELELAPRWPPSTPKESCLYTKTSHARVLWAPSSLVVWCVESRVGDYPAVIPTLSGQAWITGFAQYVVDSTDPFPNGFTLGDIWGAQED